MAVLVLSAGRDDAARRLGSFRRWAAACGRQVIFPAPGKSPKDRRGTAQDDRFTLISVLPRVLHYGDTLLFGHTSFPARKIWVAGLNFHRATGPWSAEIQGACNSTTAPGFAKPTLPVRILACRSGTGLYGITKEAPFCRSGTLGRHAVGKVTF